MLHVTFFSLRKASPDPMRGGGGVALISSFLDLFSKIRRQEPSATVVSYGIYMYLDVNFLHGGGWTNRLRTSSSVTLRMNVSRELSVVSVFWERYMV